MNKAGELHRVEGSTETRRSKRFYSHAVVGDYDRAAAVKRTTEWTTASALDNWEYNNRIASATPGKPVYFRQPGRANPIVLTYDEKRIEEAQEFISNNPRCDAYILVRVTDAIERFCPHDDGKLLVLQWSQSAANAAKAAAGKQLRRHNVRNLRVVKVQRG